MLESANGTSGFGAFGSDSASASSLPVELPAHIRSTGVPDQLSSRSTEFAAVGVSDQRSQQQLVFGDFTGTQMDQPNPPTDFSSLSAVVEANRKESEDGDSKLSVDIATSVRTQRRPFRW